MDKYTQQKVKNVLQGIVTSDPERAFILAIHRLKAQYPNEWPTPKEMPKILSVKVADIRLEKEQALELGKIVATFNENPTPGDEEAYQKALPFLKKFYPFYFDDETQKKDERHRVSLKEIIISGSCTLCGLCDQEELSQVFTYDENGKLTVRHGGVIDVGKYPKVLEVAEMCPEKAIQISDVKELSQDDINKVVEQFNRLVNKELRNYPFDVPNYYADYRYETDTYQALPIPAKYRSDARYFNDNTAENAGLLEFKKAVVSQTQNIVKQYVAAYKIKKLSKYYSYEKNNDNFYYNINNTISMLLEKAYQMAKTITRNELDVPESFYLFEIQPDWEKVRFPLEILQKLEDMIDINSSKSSHLHDIEYYRTWIATDSDDAEFMKTYYDFTEAEEYFRSDVDYAVEDAIEKMLPQWVTSVTSDYIGRAKSELAQRLDLLQSTVKKYCEIGGQQDIFNDNIRNLYNCIAQSELIKVAAPVSHIDISYDGSFRFSSEDDCLSAAENRRRRAYNEGLSFIKQLPDQYNILYMDIIAGKLTEWKREFLAVYDISGIAYPEQMIELQVGQGHLCIPLENHDDVKEIRDITIKDYFKNELLEKACYGNANGVSYLQETDCKISTHCFTDYKKSLFGEYKEINRYSYTVGISQFNFSARDVAKTYNDILYMSDFMKKYFSDIKKSFISEVYRITGVK